MIVKFLGAIDLVIGALIFFSAIGVAIPHVVFVISLLVLLAKSLPFVMSNCLASYIDIAVAIILVISLIAHLPQVVMIVAALVLLQKGLFSLF